MVDSITSEPDYPNSFLCPITLDVMEDPVMLRETGHTFERYIVEEHLKKSQTCPLTGVKLQDITLVSNHALRNAIEEFRDKEKKRGSRQSHFPEQLPLAPPRPPAQQPLPPAQNPVSPHASEGSQQDVWHLDRSKIHLGSVIGGGNQGSVYNGWMQNPDGSREEVAIKVIEANFVIEGVYSDEVAVMQRATVSCSNVCRLRGHSEDGGKRLLVMKRYDMNLKQLTEACGNALPVERCLRYGAQICAGMADLHAQQILVHDLKPENILYGKAEDHVVISDFGLPRTLGKARYNPEHLVGTPNFLAPEAWEDGGKGVSFPADVWSFGCCMIEAAAGRRPFAGQNTQGIRRLLVDRRAAPSTAGVPPPLQLLVAPCLQRVPAHRPSFANLALDFKHALRTLHSANAPPPSFAPPPSPANATWIPPPPPLDQPFAFVSPPPAPGAAHPGHPPGPPSAAHASAPSSAGSPPLPRQDDARPKSSGPSLLGALSDKLQRVAFTTQVAIEEKSPAAASLIAKVKDLDQQHAISSQVSQTASAAVTSVKSFINAHNQGNRRQPAAATRQRDQAATRAAQDPKRDS